MKSSLSLKRTQTQTLTTTQIASLDLLQKPLMELQSELETALEENPLLEGEQEEPWEHTESAQPADSEIQTSEELATGSMTEAFGEPFDALFGTRSAPYHDDDDNYLEQIAEPTDFREDTLSELRCLVLSETVLFLSQCIVDELDNHGLLPQGLDVLETEYAQQLVTEGLHATHDDWEAALAAVRRVTKPGVGAPSAMDALRLEVAQRHQEGMITDEQADGLLAILDKHLRLLAQRDYTTLQARLHVSDEAFRVLLTTFQQLNPYPYMDLSEDRTQFVTPDVFFWVEGSQVQVQINTTSLTQIRLVSASEQARIKALLPSELWQNYLSEAKQLLYRLHSRHETLFRIAHYIGQHQEAFFTKGLAGLQPLRLIDIAEALSLAESTVSRALDGKFFSCSLGTFPFKTLLSRTVKTSDTTQTSESETSSVAQIYERIKSLIAAESPASPLSDQSLTDTLNAEGYEVKRRSVSKYREQLGIPTSRLRRCVDQ